jgi:TetR/AcrR family transcriptional regulator, cholesterol catabolism regulator
MNQSPDLSRHDQKLELILRTSARIFAEKNYHSTSMRDISRATGVSLAGLYHYCKSKEELLFLIQDHCFGRVLERLKRRLAGEREPVQRLRILIENHLAFFAANMSEMKVLSHEADSLSGELQVHVSGKKEKYTRIARKILGEIQEQNSADRPAVNLTVATYALFGMMNWIYNWYNPGGKIAVNELVENVMQLFLNGFLKTSDNKRAGLPQTSADQVRVWREPALKSLMLVVLLSGAMFFRPSILHARQQCLWFRPSIYQQQSGSTSTPSMHPRRPCYGDPVYGGNLKFERVSQKPRIGIKTEGYPESVNKGPAPKNMLTAFLIIFKDVEYRVYVDSENVIQRVTTSDTKFKTPEGVALGDAADKVIAAAQMAPVNKFDCGYSVLLPSGWEAWFGSDTVAADGSLAPTAVIKSFELSPPSK